MARPVVLSKALAAADPAIVAASQSLGAAGNLALVGGGTVRLDTQRRVSILSAGDDSALTWTLYGTNESGTAISERVAGANAVAVETIQDFLTVTRVAADGASAGNVEVGTNDVGSTAWVVLNYHITPFLVGAQFVVLSGSVTGSVEVTEDDPRMPIAIYQPGYDQSLPIVTPVGWPGLTGLTGTVQQTINGIVIAARLTVTAGTGEAQLTLTQAGIRN